MSNLWLMAPPAEGQQGNPLMTFLMFGIIILIFYFLMIRPQQKRQKELKSMIESLKQGDRVITSGGLYGTVASIKDNVAVLKIADQVRVEVAKSAISGVVEKSREN